MTAREPVEFTRQLADGNNQRAGNRVQLEDGNGALYGPLNPLPGAGLTDTELRATPVPVTATPFAPVKEGGVVSLIGINDQVDINEYGASVAIALGATMSGVIESFLLVTQEAGTGAVLAPEGWLLFFDANPTIAAGDTAISAAERLTLLGQVWVGAGDWDTDANGASAGVSDAPVPFHALSTIYAAWKHKSASFNDAAGDDESMSMNCWIRRES